MSLHWGAPAAPALQASRHHCGSVQKIYSTFHIMNISYSCFGCIRLEFQFLEVSTFNFCFEASMSKVPLSFSVGHPITVPQVDNPSREQVDYYHKLYMEALSELFHTHKTSCGLADTHELRII